MLRNLISTKTALEATSEKEVTSRCSGKKSPHNLSLVKRPEKRWQRSLSSLSTQGKRSLSQTQSCFGRSGEGSGGDGGRRSSKGNEGDGGRRRAEGSGGDGGGGGENGQRRANLNLNLNSNLNLARSNGPHHHHRLHVHHPHHHHQDEVNFNLAPTNGPQQQSGEIAISTSAGELDRRRRGSNNRQRVCIWGDKVRNIQHLYSLLQPLVISIRRVEQRNNARIRYDVYCTDVEVLLARLRVMKGVHARVHRSWRVRQQLVAKANNRKNDPSLSSGCSINDRSSPRANQYAWTQVSNRLQKRRKMDSIQISSWNLSGSIRTKSSDIVHYLGLHHVDVLAMQETLRTEHHANLYFPGYHVVESPAIPDTLGARGIALLISQRFTITPIQGDNDQAFPFMIFVRLFDRQRRTGFIFGTVYVPQYRSCRRLIWTSLQTMLGKIQARYPGMPILIAGDWNLTRGNLTRMLSRKHLHEILQVNPCRGSDKTWHRRVRGEWRTSGIDHILWSGASSHSTLSHSIVDRCWDLSDHWPISCKVHLERLSQEVGHGVSEANKVQYPRMRVDVLRERRDQIIHATQWQVLEVDVPGPDEPKDSSSHIETQGGQAEGVVSVPDQSIHSDAAESDALDRYASQVVETCHSIAKEYGAHVCPRRNRKGKGDFCLSKKTKRLIDQRRKTYHRLISSSSSLGNEDSALLLESYQQLRRQCHDSVNEDKRSSWHVKMKVIAQHAKKLRLRSLFRWLRGRIQGESTSKPGDKPMLRSGNASGSMLQVQPIQYDGQLHTDEASILKCWAAYYEKLSSDETGHSQDSNHWKDVFPIPFMNATTGRSTTSTSVSTTSSSLLSHVAEDGGSLDSPITPSELCSVLRTMANGKAPGKDQIPMEFWKLILPTSTCTDATAAPNISSSSSSTKTSTTTTTTSSSSTTTTTSSSSTTMTTSTTTGQERETGSRASLLLHNPMSRVLLRLLNWIFQSGKILSSWNSSLLISIPKKGDLKDMNNYRGISLISTIVKLLSAIVTNRIRYAVEKHNVLVREQAGFRTREECAAQVIALVECVQRRWNKEMRPTYACFIDLRKAFDRVPHEALFRKLESLGIRGRCLEFYRGLYRSSWTQVSSRISDTLSPAFPFCRGVRQGDPSSPLLFDLFINDLLEQCRPFGIRVVGMPESTMVGSTENRLPGLMFADDVVLLSPSRHCLEASMRKVSEYLTQLEMEVGASKCGVTVFHGCIDKVRRRQWQLQGKDIPVVEEYRYLGIDVNCNLDEGFTVRRQIQRYRQKLHMATPFLRNGRIPLDLRLRVVKSCLLPSLVWGSEWWGMHQLHAKRLSLVLNQTLRMVVGVHAKHTGVSIPALYTELGIPSMESLIAGRRARLWAKGPSMRTWISQLCQWIPTFRKGTWVKNTKAWLLRRLGSSAVREIERSPRGSKALQRAVQQVIHHKWLTTGKMTQTNTWQQYCQYALQNGSALLRDSSLDFPEYSKSLSWLMRIRVGGWSSCSRLARIGILDEQWKTRCPCCLANVPETLSHLQQKRCIIMLSRIAAAHPRNQSIANRYSWLQFQLD